jgi:hypothetical protein
MLIERKKAPAEWGWYQAPRAAMGDGGRTTWRPRGTGDVRHVFYLSSGSPEARSRMPRNLSRSPPAMAGERLPGWRPQRWPALPKVWPAYAVDAKGPHAHGDSEDVALLGSICCVRPKASNIAALRRR